MDTILVQNSHPQWTTKAMHLACAMTRNTDSKLVLLHLIPVKNPGLLGTVVGVGSFSRSEEQNFKEYGMIAGDYGVSLTLQPMQYLSLSDALVQAVENINAYILFAHLPDSYFHFWHRLQTWNLGRQLTGRGCQLYTLETADPVRIQPATSLKTAK